MKKLFFVITAFVAMFVATDAAAQITVGGGYNHGSLINKRGGERESSGLNGVYVEATYDLNFFQKSWGELAFQPGARLSYMGFRESAKESGIKVKQSLSETYFDVPLHLKYTYPLEKIKVSAFAGPVMSLGLSSTNRYSVTGGGQDSKGKVNKYAAGSADSDSESTYGRFDIKFALGLGADLTENISVKLGYNIGMLNRYKAYEYGDGPKFKIHTNVFYLGVGYTF